MPRNRGLVTILTTGLVAFLAGLIGSGLLVPGAGGETVRQGGLQVSFGGSVAPKVAMERAQRAAERIYRA